MPTKKKTAVKKGKKPSPSHLAKVHGQTANVGQKAGAKEDVSAQGYLIRVACWNCLRINLINSDWDFFVCGWCGATNWRSW